MIRTGEAGNKEGARGALYVQAFGAVDTTLAQQWPALPKGTQEQFSAVYQRFGMPSPGQRK